MSSFAALMALSATQTRQAEVQVQSALAERQRKEAQKRKQQEEKERRDKEMEAKLRLKILEEQKREQERQKRIEAERQAKEAAARKKEEEQRDALRYGPKKGKADYPSSGHGARDGERRRKASSDDESGGGMALTREEKRRARLDRELSYGLGGHKRAGGGGYKKAGRRLPGGAVDVSAADGGATSSFRSVKDRIAHQPPGLIKLNTNKRDTRTIDEIRLDIERKKNKTLSGDDAKGFDDWFGNGKTKVKGAAGSAQQQPHSRASSIFSSRSPSPVDEKVPPPKPQARTTKSLSRTPPAPAPVRSSQPSTYASAFRAPPRGTGISVRPITNALEKSSLGGKSSKAPAKSAATKAAAQASRASLAAGKSSSAYAPVRKRPRSPSLSESPPPPKRRAGSALPQNLSSEIWKILGRDRSQYMARAVDSDDDDMEADAMDLEHEELYRSVSSFYRAVVLHSSRSFAVLKSRARRTNWHWRKRDGMRRRSAGERRRGRGEARFGRTVASTGGCGVAFLVLSGRFTSRILFCLIISFQRLVYCQCSSRLYIHIRRLTHVRYLRILHPRFMASSYTLYNAFVHHSSVSYRLLSLIHARVVHLLRNAL